MKARIRHCLALCLLISPHCLAGDIGKTEVSLNRFNETDFELVFSSNEITDVAMAQRALQASATDACGSKPAQFGHFKFESHEPVQASGAAATLILRQQIHCGEAKPDLNSADAAFDTGWEPSESDQIQAKLQFAEFFDALIQGDESAAFSRFSEKTAAALDFKQWQNSRKAFKGQAGDDWRVNITRMTWYNNPPGSPSPGIFVAIDYSGTAQSLALNCGYLVWQRHGANRYSLVRMEDNTLDSATAALLDADAVAKTRSAFGCIGP